MEDHKIEIIITNLDVNVLSDMLMFSFAYKHSMENDFGDIMLYDLRDLILEYENSKDKDVYRNEGYKSNYLFHVIYKDYQSYGENIKDLEHLPAEERREIINYFFEHESIKIATIRYFSFSSFIVLVIDNEDLEWSYEYLRTEIEAKYYWSLVVRLTRVIISNIKEAGGNILKISPSNILTEVLPPIRNKENNLHDLTGTDFIKSPPTSIAQPSLEKLNTPISIDPDDIPQYGTDRDLSRNQVKDIVKRCKERKPGVSVSKFYNFGLSDEEVKKFNFETLRKWIQDERFN